MEYLISCAYVRQHVALFAEGVWSYSTVLVYATLLLLLVRCELGVGPGLGIVLHLRVNQRWI